MGEPVTEEQDARDVLLAFGTREVRYRRPPFGERVGLEADPADLARRMPGYAPLLESLRG